MKYSQNVSHHIEAGFRYHDPKTLPEQVLLGMKRGYGGERAGRVWLAVDVAIPAVIGRFQNHATESRTLWTMRRQLNTQVLMHYGSKRELIHLEPMISYIVFSFKYSNKAFIANSGWVFGYGQMERALSMHGWTAYRDVPDSRGQSQRRGLRQKTQSDASVTHMGRALPRASEPKLLQGTQMKHAQLDMWTLFKVY